MLTCISLLKRAGVGFLALATSFQAVGAVTFSHDKPACIPKGESSKVAFKLESNSMIASVRVYFHAAQYKSDYYLEMRHGEGSTYWVVLPRPLSETKDVVYRFRVVDMEGKEHLSEDFKVPVKSSCDAPLTSAEQMYGNNLVIGLVDMSMPVVPEGFSCEGVVAKITLEGVLMPHDECRQALAAVVIPPGVFLAAGAVAAVGTGIVVSGGGGGAPVSPIRPAANTGTAPK